MSAQDIGTRVIAVASRVLGVEVSLEDSRESLAAWDSLANVDLIFSVEEEFNVKLPSELLGKLNSVGDFVEALKNLDAS